MSDVIPIDLDKASRTKSKLDAISLEQALKDFEIANARVVDLTQRLLDSERRRAETANELEQLRLRGSTATTSSSAPASSPIAAMAVKVSRRLVRAAYQRLMK